MSAAPTLAEPEERSLHARLGLWIGPLACALILAGLLPGLDSAQRAVAGVTAWTVTWWMTGAVPVGAASLLPAALFPVLGVMPASVAAPIYLRDLVMLFLGAFVIALGLERWGVHRRMALSILVRFGTSRRLLVLGFMCAAAFTSCWINNTATTLLMLPIVLAVLDRVEGDGEQQSHSSFATCLLLGTAYAASVGGMGSPVGTAPNQEFLGQLAQRFPEAPKLGFGDWMLAWMPFVILFVPMAWWLLTRVLLPIPADDAGDSGIEAVREERANQGPMNSAQRRMAVVFGATALLWVTRADLNIGSLQIPGWSRLLYGSAASDPLWLAAHKNDVSDATVAIFMALVCFALPAGKGRGALMDWRTAKRLPWDVLLLLGGGFCIAKGFQVSGLDRVLGGLLAPLYEDTSSWLVVGGTALLVSFLTELTSNTATTAVLLPVVGAAGVQAGLDPVSVMAPAALAASAAFMMPVATPPNAVVFGSGRLKIGTMARVGLVLNLLAVVLLTLVFQLWVRRVWHVEDGLPSWAGG
ncbi:MAG: sodium-dependent dicarboxylate transporter 2/3/5 [Planctomycetota bacterium]